MTTEEKIEAHANLVKWCVHILGPDDVIAAPSHAVAVARAREMNQAFRSREEKLEDVLCFAYAAPWPYSEASHATALMREAAA